MKIQFNYKFIIDDFVRVKLTNKPAVSRYETRTDEKN